VETVLLQMSIYVAAAVVAVPLAQRLGLGSVLGYLAAGVAIGPIFGLVGAEAEDVQHYSEFGIVLMLFLIGLELEPRALWEMRARFFGLGGLQVGLTLAAVAALSRAIGLPWNQALVLGMVLSLSSTAIVLQTLTEKRLTRTEGGRTSLAVLLFQDVAAVPFLALVPLLAIGAVPPEGEGELQILDHVGGLTKAAMVVGATAAVILAGRFLTHPIFRFLSWARLDEIYIAAAMLFVGGVALVMSLVGLSPAIGSFLAGVALARSEYRHELEADIAPFKGLLLGLFFMSVGADMDLGLLAERPLDVLALTLALMALKLGILYGLARLFGIAGRARVLFALALAQAGEFGFVLASFAADTWVLPPARADTVLLVISLSMALTPALFLAYDAIAARIGGGRAADEIDEQGTVIICGMGRFGQTVNRLLAGLGHKTVVIDRHADTIERMRRVGIKGFYGDAARPELLAAAGIAEARALVLAIDDAEMALRVASQVRRRYPELPIVARARDRHHVYALHAAGATESVREVFEGAVRAGERVLSSLGYDETEVERIAEAFMEHDRTMLAELAALWDPAVPPERNAAYRAKEREQHEAIVAALRGRRGAGPPPEGPAGEAAAADAQSPD
jgi:CPA2 family monovalent cation:H+ antiporter-2